VDAVTTTDLHAVHDPGLAWLAARLRWEHTLEGLRLHRAVTGSPSSEQERPAA
jgi:hypothetical protein